jgi:chromosome segregation ATPase
MLISTKSGIYHSVSNQPCTDCADMKQLLHKLSIQYKADLETINKLSNEYDKLTAEKTEHVNTIEDQTETIEEQTETIEEQTETIEDHEAEIERLNRELVEIAKEHADEINELKTEYAESMVEHERENIRLISELEQKQKQIDSLMERPK